jgi:hypothetical protein
LGLHIGNEAFANNCAYAVDIKRKDFHGLS